MKNVNELRLEMVKVLQELRAGSIKPADAEAANNTAGKIINSVKIELQYAKDRFEKPNIAFLNESGEKNLEAKSSTTGRAL